MSSRLLIANLDCEQDYAYRRAPRRLPRMVRARISALGTLMAALGRPGDVLLTSEPVAPARALLARARGVTLVSGGLPEPGEFDRVLAWGETWRVDDIRSSYNTRGPRGSNSEQWPEAAWHTRASPDSAMCCNDRRYAFALNARLGRQLPGAVILDSVAALEAHLRAGGHEHGRLPDDIGAASESEGESDGRTWVLEAPFSASGRFRLRRRGGVLSAAARTRARRLFDTFGQLIFQPWVERVVDVSSAGFITGEDRWTMLGQHVLETDRAGVFRGLVLTCDSGAQVLGALPSARRAPAERALAASAEVISAVARALAADGYRGPFGIDGFGYRDPSGALQLYPLCEINARVTFGLLAHELARAHDLGRCRLGVSQGPLPALSRGGLALLAPGASDPTSAWIAPL